jgi:hypothetical protein
VSDDGTTYGASVTVSNPTVLYARWKDSCVKQKTGDTIQGTVAAAGVGTNSYSLQLAHVPTNALSNIADTNVALGATVSKATTSPITGLNAPAYVTIAGAGNTGTAISASTSATGPWTLLATTGTNFPLANGDTLYIQQTVGTSTSTGYVANIQVGDDPAVAGAAFTSFSYTATTVNSAALPTGVYNPTAGRPNASPYDVTYLDPGALGQLYGKSATSWDGAITTTLTPGANTLMSIGAGIPGSTPISAANGNTVNVAVDPTYAGGLATGATATASFTSTYSGVNYTNSFSFTVQKGAAFTVPTGASGGAGTVTIASQNVTNINVPVKLYQTPGTPAITSVTVDINGNGPVPLPTSIGTALTLNPGDTVAFSATAPAGVATYTTDITIGDTTETWSYEVTVTPTVDQPNITLPTAPATNLNPALNSPAGITIATPAAGVAGGYIDNYGGSQVESSWYVYKANAVNPETSAITAVGTSATGGMAWSSGLNTEPTWSNYPNVGTVDFGAGWATSTLTVNSVTGQGTNDSIGCWWAPSPTGPWTRTNSFTIVFLPGTMTPANRYLRLSLFNGADVSTATATLGGGTTFSSVVLTLTNNTDLANMVVGDVVQQDNASITTGARLFWDPANTSYRTLADLIANTTEVTSWADQPSGGVYYWVRGASETRTPGTPIWLTNTAANLPSWSFFYNTVDGDPLFNPGGGYGGSEFTLFDWIAPGVPNAYEIPTDAYIVKIARSIPPADPANATISPSGTITAINAAGPTITLSPSNGTWSAGTGNTAIDTSRTITAPAPTTFPPSFVPGTKYTAVTGFGPKVVTSGTFDSTLIPQADLTTSSTYYASVIYTGSGTPNVDSTASAWKSFTTASSFTPAPGTAMDGGYFGGQINDGGIVYNLIVAPKATGENTSGLAWKNAASSDTNPPSQNETYGFPMSQVGFAAGAATYPALHWARSVTASGYNDWYVPAKNELEVLYYFLKPDPASGGTANNTSSGSNPNAVAPEPVSTNYTATNPAQTTSSLFVSGTGTEAFSTSGPFWTATESSGVTTSVWRQYFDVGTQGTVNKTSVANSVRAIRRTYANAPVAIGAAYGGGYFAGQYQDGGITYNLIVAPVTSGGLNGQFGGATPTGIQWMSTSADTPVANNLVYGGTATTSLAAPAQPLFDWCVNNATGPNGGAGIGGHTDWYIPAKNEMEILINNLGPNWTTATDFQSAGGQKLSGSFGAGTAYWTSSQVSTTPTTAWSYYADNGRTDQLGKNTSFYARAVRRELA